jgi:hypothetical protein
MADNRISSPPPAYHTNPNAGWDFFGDNSNHHLSENTSYKREPVNNYSNNYSNNYNGPYGATPNPYASAGVNNNIPPGTERGSRLFRINTELRQKNYTVDARFGTWTLAYQFTHFIAATILLCVCGVAIKLYQDPWHQAQVVGSGASLAYSLAGLIVGCVAVCNIHSDENKKED